jgi:SAM-dependent methyltransferase
MFSRRTLFGLGLSRVAERVEEQFDQQAREPAPPKGPSSSAPRPRARPRVPPPRPSWPHRRGAELWEPATQALPRPEGALVLEADELDYDLARLPFEDGEFDVVVSSFAPMFSSDGRAAIAELFRIVRPGGTVAFCTWTPPGIVGRLLALAAENDPRPPTGVPAPLDWCSAEYLRHELEHHSDDVELRPQELTMTFASVEDAVDRLFAAFRPLAWAPDQSELRRQAAEIVTELAGEDAGAVAPRATYVMAVARRRSA